MHLNDFSGLIIPDAAASDTILSSARNNIVPLRSGIIDLDGGRSYSEVQQLGRQGWFISDIDRSVDALRKRMAQGAGTLRAVMRDGTKRMTPAKITQLVTNADSNSWECWQPYTIRFQQTYPYWLNEADGWFFDNGYTFDSGMTFDWATQTFNISATPLSFTVNNNGDGFVPQMFIHVICGATATLTDFTLYNDTNGLAFRYQTPLPINTHLIIDTLGRAITSNYSDNAYSGFSLLSTDQTSWMRLEPGANAMRLVYTSKANTPTIGFQFLRHFP